MLIAGLPDAATYVKYEMASPMKALAESSSASRRIQDPNGSKYTDKKPISFANWTGFAK